MKAASVKGAFITSPGVKREHLLAKENTASFYAQFTQKVLINVLTPWLLQQIHASSKLNCADRNKLHLPWVALHHMSAVAPAHYWCSGILLHLTGLAAADTVVQWMNVGGYRLKHRPFGLLSAHSPEQSSLLSSSDKQ